MTTDNLKVSPKKVAGTRTSEQIIGTAAAKLTAASKAALDAWKQVEKIEEAVQTSTLKLTDVEQKISESEVIYQQKLSQQKFDMELAFKTDQVKFCNDYLSTNNLISVRKEDYDKLNQSLTSLQSEFNAKVASEVNSVKETLQRNYENDIKLKESEFNARQAQNTADIDSLTRQLKAANDTAEQWREALVAERQAGVERAKAASIGSVNLSSPSR